VKTLYVIRHAKSSWDVKTLDDIERRLNDRGKRDAPRMGKRLKEKEVHPDLILSSPAKRAFMTAKRIARILKYAKENIKVVNKLYHGDEDAMLEVLNKLKEKHNTVILFGHNPGLTDFVNSIMSEEQDIDNVPTCGVVAFQFQADRWEQVTWGTGKMVFFDYPKSRED
jgi:phosphohistidine phosphatase